LRLFQNGVTTDLLIKYRLGPDPMLGENDKRLWV